jgi:hypothetical protein
MIQHVYDTDGYGLYGLCRQQAPMAPMHFVIDTLRPQQSHDALMDGNRKRKLFLPPG